MIDVRGKVWLSFIIEKDGHLTNIKVIRTIEPIFDAEALRVMKHSPKWIPAKKNKAPVRYWYALPISFDMS
jgi:protein TonB